MLCTGSIRQVLSKLSLLLSLKYVMIPSPIVLMVMLYCEQAYIEPFLFGRPKPKKSAAESLASIEEAINNVQLSTTELKAEIHTELSRISQERESGAARNLADIKSDIATVKGLLLSRFVYFLYYAIVMWEINLATVF